MMSVTLARFGTILGPDAAMIGVVRVAETFSPCVSWMEGARIRGVWNAFIFGRLTSMLGMMRLLVGRRGRRFFFAEEWRWERSFSSRF